MNNSQNHSDNFDNDFRTIAENSVLGIIVCNLNWNIFYINKKCAEILGYDSAEEACWVGDVLNLMVEGDHARISQLRNQKGIGDNNIIEINFEALRSDGSSVFVAGNAANILWRGKPARFKTFVDISGKRLAGQEREAEKKRFQQFAEISSDWFWEMDQDLTYSYISEKFMDNGGLPRDNIIGQTPPFCLQQIY